MAIISILFLVAFTYALNESIISIFDGNLIFFSFDPPRLLRRIVGWAPGILGFDVTLCPATSVIDSWGLFYTIDVLLMLLCWACYGSEPDDILLVGTTEGIVFLSWSEFIPETDTTDLGCI